MRPLLLTAEKYTPTNKTSRNGNGATEETIPTKLRLHGHPASRIEGGAAKILIDAFLSANSSWDKGWSGYLTGENSTKGGDL